MAEVTDSAAASMRPASLADRLRHERLPAALFLAFALVPPAATLLRDPFLIVLGTRVLIFAIAALSLDLILGYGAMVSFGHAVFLGLGAYAVGIASVHGLSEGLVTFPLAIALAALFALATGAICLKTRGVYFIMITLAFGQMAFFTATSLSAYGGDDGLPLASRSTFAGLDPFAHRTGFFYAVLACLAGAYGLCRAIVASRFGRVLQGCRQSTLRMQAIGFDPYRYQLAAYVIAAALAGLAGALFANHTEFISPAYLSWQRSGDLIVMVVLGGMGTLHGAILGAAAYLLFEEALARFTEHWRLVFGPLLIVLVFFARGGLVRLWGARHG